MGHFPDADTILEKGFLNELNAYLAGRAGYAVGTVSLRPLPETLAAGAWFWIYNIGHLATRTSFSIKMVKRSLFPSIRFDEAQAFGEDLHVIAKARRHGKFFFMWTRSAFTSTRRFEKVGWLSSRSIWTFGAFIPQRLQRRIGYEIVR